MHPRKCIRPGFPRRPRPLLGCLTCCTNNSPPPPNSPVTLFPSYSLTRRDVERPYTPSSEGMGLRTHRRGAGLRFWCLGGGRASREDGEEWVRSSKRPIKNETILKFGSATVEQGAGETVKGEAEDPLIAYLGRGQLQRGASGTLFELAAKSPTIAGVEAVATISERDEISSAATGDSHGSRPSVMAQGPTTLASASGPASAAGSVTLGSAESEDKSSIYPIFSPFQTHQDLNGQGDRSLAGVEGRLEDCVPSENCQEGSTTLLTTVSHDDGHKTPKPVGLRSTKNKSKVNTPPNSDRLRVVCQFSDESIMATGGTVLDTRTEHSGTDIPADSFKRATKLASESCQGLQSGVEGVAQNGEVCKERLSKKEEAASQEKDEEEEGEEMEQREGSIGTWGDNHHHMEEVATCSDVLSDVSTGGLDESHLIMKKLTRVGLNDGFDSYGNVIIGGKEKKVVRRHTAIVLMPSSSDDDSDCEDLLMFGDEAGSCTSIKCSPGNSNCSSSYTVKSISSDNKNADNIPRRRSVQRRLSEVYQGHHVQLHKLRRQMGDTQEPPGDLLSLMARRVFSQRGVMTRVDSEGMVSALFDTKSSSFQTPPERQDSQSNGIGVGPSGLPRIRTRIPSSSAMASLE